MAVEAILRNIYNLNKSQDHMKNKSMLLASTDWYRTVMLTKLDEKS